MLDTIFNFFVELFIDLEEHFAARNNACKQECHIRKTKNFLQPLFDSEFSLRERGSISSAKCVNHGLVWPSEPNIVSLARPNIVM